MPIYEYHCESCESDFEVLQRIGEDEKDLHCPQCGHDKVKKQFSAFATAGGGTRREAASKSSRSGCGAGGFT